MGVLPFLKELHTLALSHTLLTDAGIAEIAKVPKLKRLYLDGTLLSEAGLKVLQPLPLLSLSYVGTRAVKDGVDGFVRSRP
jgi:hypothetical protein